MTFLDSNVCVYAVDMAQEEKHAVSMDILRNALARPSQYRISTQVLSEFACVLIRKLKFPTPQLLTLLRQLETIPVIETNVAMINRAVELQAMYGIQFYDAQIVAAAEQSGCSRLLSEDLNANEIYSGIQVVNPFAP